MWNYAHCGKRIGNKMSHGFLCRMLWLEWDYCRVVKRSKRLHTIWAAPNSLPQAGDLLYCKVRGQTNCCFKNDSCVGDMKAVNERLLVQSINFLKYPKKFLEKTVKEKGYDSCFQIKGYDASRCHENCKQQEKTVFAKNCTDNGGLYKCCIR